MSSITLYLGLDVHKDSLTIAIAEPGPKGEIRLFGTITNDVDRLEKALLGSCVPLNSPRLSAEVGERSRRTRISCQFVKLVSRPRA